MTSDLVYMNQLSAIYLSHCLPHLYGGNTDMIMYILETIERREGGISEADRKATARALKEFFSIYATPEGEGLQLYPCAVPESKGLAPKEITCEFAGHN